MREYKSSTQWLPEMPIRAFNPAEAAKIYAIRNGMDSDEVWEVEVGDLVFIVQADVEVTYTARLKSGRP